MAKYASPEFLDGGFTAFKANVNSMRLLNTYAAGDSYATVIANSICPQAMVTGDFTLSGADAAPRLMTVAAKSGATANASTSGTVNLHIAFIDTVNSKVYWVTDETSDQSVTSGNTVNFPALTYTRPQPV